MYFRTNENFNDDFLEAQEVAPAFRMTRWLGKILIKQKGNVYVYDEHSVHMSTYTLRMMKRDSRRALWQSRRRRWAQISSLLVSLLSRFDKERSIMVGVGLGGAACTVVSTCA